MSIGYYNKRLERLRNKIDIYRFAVEEINDVISGVYEELSGQDKIIVKLKFLLPSSESHFFKRFLDEGIVKSHEYLDLLNYANLKIVNAITSKAFDYNYSYETIDLFKSRVVFDSFSEKTNSDKKVIGIGIYFEGVKNLTVTDITTAIKICVSNKANFSDQIRLYVYKNEVRKSNLVVNHKLKKVLKTSNSNIITINDRNGLTDYYSNPDVMKLLFEYFFPDSSSTTICKITYDKLQKDQEATKSLRIKKGPNRYEKITEFLTPSTTNQEFREIIYYNSIGAFYCGTQDVENHLKYFVFDFDVSKFFKYSFERNKQVIFTLLKNVANAIIRVVREFGIQGYPVVKFSGSRGLHLLYRKSKSSAIGTKASGRSCATLV